VRSELAVPLRVADEVRGVINVDSERLNAFTEEDQTLLQDLATLAAPAIGNTWLYEQAKLKARLLESLVRVGKIINSTLNSTMRCWSSPARRARCCGPRWCR
jgi:Nif-specific regulatory protein